MGFSDAALTNASRAVFAIVPSRSSQIFARRGRSRLGVPGQGVAGISTARRTSRFHPAPAGAAGEAGHCSAAQGRSGDLYTLTIASGDREISTTRDGQAPRLFDWINVMSYDFFNSLTPTTGHHAGLFERRRRRRPIAMPIPRSTTSGGRHPPKNSFSALRSTGRGFTGVTPLNNGSTNPTSDSRLRTTTPSCGQAHRQAGFRAATGRSRQGAVSMEQRLENLHHLRRSAIDRQQGAVREGARLGE